MAMIGAPPGRDAADYGGLVPEGCEVLAGPAFALLRPDFGALRERALLRRAGKPPRCVLVAMGLTDVGGSTRRAVACTVKPRRASSSAMASMVTQ